MALVCYDVSGEQSAVKKVMVDRGYLAFMGFLGGSPRLPRRWVSVSPDVRSGFRMCSS